MMENSDIQAPGHTSPSSFSAAPPSPENYQHNDSFTQSSVSKFKKTNLIFVSLGLLLFLLISYFVVNQYSKVNSIPKKVTKLVTDRLMQKEAATVARSVMPGWKVHECIYDGYRISHPADVTPHNAYLGDTSCASYFRYQGADEQIYINMSDKQISAHDEYTVYSDEEKIINGIRAKYLEVETYWDLETKKLLIYEYPGNGRYYRLIYILNYHDPRQDLDFYKDTQWGQMIDEFNKIQTTSVGGQTQPVTSLEIFHNMAQTFVLTVPVPVPVTELESCLKRASENLSRNGIKIRKATDDPNIYFTPREDDELIRLQHKTEVNECYRKYKEKGMKDCFMLYPNDLIGEYECNSHNEKPYLLIAP